MRLTAARAPRAVLAPAVLWRFARPHTVVGTLVSALALYVLAATERAGPAPGAADLAWTLLAALAVNVAIVGLNQLTDVEIDRVNKPGLPLAAGTMTAGQARAVVATAAVVPVVLALTQGALELAGVLVALAAGAAYSLPPVRLKRFPAAAAASIAGVRALVVNLVVYGHFAGSTASRYPDAVWALTLFVVPFSLAIAVLKDVPDLEGDRRFRIATFSVRLGPERAAAAGLALLLVAHAGMAVAALVLVDGVSPVVLAVGNGAAVGLLLAAWRSADVRDRRAFTRFYLRVWALLYAQYGLVALAAATG